MQRTIRILLTFIFSITTFWICAQKTPHAGTYYTTKKDRGFESDIFQFNEDGTFSYVFFTCTGIGLGKGHYKITDKDSLQLQFIDCTDCEEKVQIQMDKIASDSIEVNLSISHWGDGSNLAGASVYFVKESIGKLSDKEGQAVFKAGIVSESRILRVEYIGYDPIDIVVPANTSRLTGKVALSWGWVYDSTDVKMYKISKWTASTLRLKRNQKALISYDKVAPQNVDKLIEGRLGTNGYKLYKENIKTPH